MHGRPAGILSKVSPFSVFHKSKATHTEYYSHVLMRRESAAHSSFSSFGTPNSILEISAYEEAPTAYGCLSYPSSTFTASGMGSAHSVLRTRQKIDLQSLLA